MANHSNNRRNSRANASSDAVAKTKAKAQQNKTHDKQAEGQFSIDGDIRLTAGASFDLTGFGRFDGKWQIQQATHRISRHSGYTTEVQFRKVASLDDGTGKTPKAKKAKSKKAKASRKNTHTRRHKVSKRTKQKANKPKLVVYDLVDGKLTKS